LPPEVCADIPRPRKDTILLSKDGSVGIAYKVEEDLGMVTSSGILHLSVKDPAVLPDYLTLVLNSPIVRLQAERDAGGSIIQHWKESEIKRVKIPLLPIPDQEHLADKVRSSFVLRAESRRLLDVAKRTVETAIEQGEQPALRMIEAMTTGETTL
jgi:type I restriction enzyme S subunit